MNQAVGAITVPSQVTLSQKTTVGRLELPSVTTFPSDQRATPSMRRMNAVAPGAERRRHATSASQADMVTEIISGITYGVNCQCIALLSATSQLLHLHRCDDDGNKDGHKQTSTGHCSA